jgi:diacylglycerol kinase family enzyme
LVGNCGQVFGGIDVFPNAELDDGLLDVALVTAEGVVRRVRVIARAVVGDPAASPDVLVTTARKVRVDLDRAMPVELDGGVRPARKRVKMRVDPCSVTVCVPSPEDRS